MPEAATKPPRKKKPKQLAVIHVEGCTGCEACIVFCPVDCIDLVKGPRHMEVDKVCVVDYDRCIGCTLCAKYCPWETIEMYAHEDVISEQEPVAAR